MARGVHPEDPNPIRTAARCAVDGDRHPFADDVLGSIGVNALPEG